MLYKIKINLYKLSFETRTIPSSSLLDIKPVFLVSRYILILVMAYVGKLVLPPVWYCDNHRYHDPVTFPTCLLVLVGTPIRRYLNLFSFEKVKTQI